MKQHALFILLLISLHSFGQVRIAGKLTDTKNKPLGGASISIKNSYDGTTTDSLGRYSFTTLEKGTQVLQACFSGYSLFQKTFDLESKDLEINISV